MQVLNRRFEGRFCILDVSKSRPVMGESKLSNPPFKSVDLSTSFLQKNLMSIIGFVKSCFQRGFRSAVVQVVVLAPDCNLQTLLG